MTEASSGDFSTVTLKIILGADPEFPLVIPQERAEKARVIQAGSRVRIVDQSKDPGEEWFVGYVGQDAILIQGSPQQESYQISVYGPEWLLAGSIITGQWYANSSTDRKIVFGNDSADDRVRLQISSSDIPCIFNADGLPDMSQELWTVGTKDKIESPIGGAVFVSGDRRILDNGATVSEAKQWTAYRALRSTVEWIDDYNVISPQAIDWAGIESTLGGVRIAEVSIDGMTLLRAIRAILRPLGYGFALNVVSDGESKHALSVFALKSQVTGKTPYLAPVGSKVTDANGTRAELSRVDNLRDSHNIRNSTTVCGQPEMIQNVLEYKSSENDLWPAWDRGENLIPLVDGVLAVVQLSNPESFYESYHTKGANFQPQRDVWRTFIFNEDGGGLDRSEFTETDWIPNLPDYGLGESMFRRPIGDRLLRSSVTSDFVPALVEMEVTTNGTKFTIDVSDEFEILKDRAGIRFTGEFFRKTNTGADVEAWRPFNGKVGTPGEKLSTAQEAVSQLAYLTMLSNTLNVTGADELILRVTGTMQKDLCVKGFVDRQNTSPLHLTRERLVRNPALQAKTVFGGSTGLEDTRDDSSIALAQAKAISFADDSEIGHSSLMFLSLTKGYPPGTPISQTAGRVVKFQLDGQRVKSSPVVVLVKHTFGKINTTEVNADSPLLRIT